MRLLRKIDADAAQLTEVALDAQEPPCDGARTLHAAHARVEIDRLEADSKFFRGMVIALAAIALHYLVTERRVLAGLGVFGLSVMSFNRFRDQQWKMTELTYATAVIVHADKRPRPLEGSGANQASPHHGSGGSRWSPLRCHHRGESGCLGREPSLNQTAESGLRASLRSDHNVLRQTASLTEATSGPLRAKLTGLSSL